MLIEKEIISPGSYWYTDEATGLPRKLDVTPDLTRYWCEQGNKMLSAGLTVPVPFEHDFNAHPMTPKEKLLNNSGWAKEYRLRDDKLFGVLDIEDENVAKKLPKTIRWTSPWINSFTDGNGNAWNNVISHVALTLRPRITKQAPFGSLAAALSLATPTVVTPTAPVPSGFCLSRAGRLLIRKRDGAMKPRYPMAFSMLAGVTLAADDMPMPKKKPMAGKDGKPTPPDASGEDEFEDSGGEDLSDTGGTSSTPDDGDPTNASTVDLEPYNDPKGDVKMEELLCDLLSALGVHCEKSADEADFKRNLYTAAMTKIHELTAKAQAADASNPQGAGSNTPSQPGQPNPLIQQEQQPMYMSLEEINKLDGPLRTVALSLYNEMVKANAKAAESEKTLNSLRDAKLKEAAAKRAQRVALLAKVSPRVKADLEAMVAAPSMALSMGDGGTVIDPMEQTLAMLEKSLGDLPRLMTTDTAALAVQPHPTDADALTEEQENKLADSLARMMGAPPEKKTA